MRISRWANSCKTGLNKILLKQKHITKKAKSKPSPWLHDEIKHLMNERDQALRKARKNNNDNDWSRYKTLRNKTNNLLKKSKSDYHRNLIEENEFQPKKFWKVVKEVFPNKTNVSSIPFPSTTSSDNRKPVDIFKSYFSTTVQFLKTKSFPLLNFVWRMKQKYVLKTPEQFRFSYVSNVFVLKQLKTLKCNKATGFDELPSRIIIDCVDNISQPLTHIINLSLKSSMFPNAWKIAKIVPIYKSGPSNNPENYRPISVFTHLRQSFRTSSSYAVFIVFRRT